MLNFDPRSIHSKVARRIFAVFLVCAFFPFAVLAVATYFQITTYFTAEQERQLRELAKSTAMSIYERLTFLDGDLSAVAKNAIGSDMPVTGAPPETHQSNTEPLFRGFAIMKINGERSVIRGSVVSFGKIPELTSAEKTHLKSGKTLIVTVHNPNHLPAQILMIKMVDPARAKEGTLIGEVNDDYLWGFSSVTRLPAYIQLCLLNHLGIPIICSRNSSRSLASYISKMSLNSGSGDFTSVIEGEKYLGSYWSLPLKFTFHIPKLTIVVQRSKDDVFSSSVDFKRNLLLVTLLALTLSMLLGTYQIRKRLVPVEQLKEGTQRVARQDFDLKLTISTKDEFEELADAFNSMATRLGRQFHTLSTISEIDRAVLSLLDTEKIIDTILVHLSNVFFSDCVAVALFDSRGTNNDKVYYSLTQNRARTLAPKDGEATAKALGHVENSNNGVGHETFQWVSQSKTLRTRRNIITLTIESNSPLVISDIPNDPRIPESVFARENRFESCLALPLIIKNDILGVVIFFSKQRRQFTDQDIEFLAALTRQASIAIHNSQLYERTKEQAMALAKANKAKSEFLSVMSHELRTPLNVVMGYQETLHAGSFGKLNSDQEKALSKAMERSLDLLRMINGILDATTLDSGTVRVQDHEFDLVGFLDTLKANYDIQLSKDVRLVWNYPPDLPDLNTDSGKLKQILQNLINNAIKFTKAGQVKLSVRLIDEARSVEFKVADTGVGIPQESLSDIFEMFRQVDSSETRSYEGVGLGLYIVKKLTELIGGRLQVESNPGKGSTFTITIPRVYKNRSAPEVSEPPDRNDSHTLSI